MNDTCRCRYRRRFNGASALVCALLLAGCASPAPHVGDTDPAVQAYVSAALLGHWCRSSQPIDTEACLSYLRGHFDTLAVTRAAETDVSLQHACIPATAAITELREQVRGRVADADVDRALPAARMLVELWRARYPCAAPRDAAPASGG